MASGLLKRKNITLCFKICVYFLENLMKTKLLFMSLLLFCCLLNHGASGVDTDIMSVSVMEGDSVTLHTGVETNQQDRIRWYFNDTRIAQITGDLSKTCTDVQCNKGTERFRDRLKLDNQTGSLTIMNITNTDSGLYKARMSNGIIKKFNVTVTGASGVDTDIMSVSVMEGDSVTLHTGVETNQQDRIRWYFGDTRIAQISGDFSKTCTDVQCNEGTERFRDRLKLDHQTGSLTIMNITNTDSGVYKAHMSNDIIKKFNVTVTGASGDDTDIMSVSVMEGDSVTLHTGVETNQQDRIRWYFGDTRIAQITGDLRKICTDVQCNEGTERFRDRLKLDHQTGSLTIMNTGITDSGVYKLLMSNDIIKTFSVTVTAVSDSTAAASAVGAAVLLVAAACMM
uniref:Immunoglobulin domain-containing protein n=1 Tax=Cyprinus carpio TaxID=7962 RepID=A0A8C1T6E8_CYPCA